MGVIFQCNACRALGSAVDVVLAPQAVRAGLVCCSCGHTSWLPISGKEASAGPSTTSTTAPLLLPGPQDLPTVTGTSELAVAEAMPDPLSRMAERVVGMAVAPAFDVEKVRDRLRRLPAAAPDQAELAQRFDWLLSTSWANETEHKRLLKTAAMSGELAFVGGRYRAVLDVVRDEPRAKAAQQELLTLAMGLAVSQRKELGSSEQGGPKSAQIVVALVLIALFLTGAAFLAKNLANSISGGIDQIDQ